MLNMIKINSQVARCCNFLFKLLAQKPIEPAIVLSKLFPEPIHANSSYPTPLVKLLKDIKSLIDNDELKANEKKLSGKYAAFCSALSKITLDVEKDYYWRLTAFFSIYDPASTTV